MQGACVCDLIYILCVIPQCYVYKTSLHNCQIQNSYILYMYIDLVLNCQN